MHGGEVRGLPAEGLWARMRRVPFAVWVISGGLLYSALALAYLTIPFALVAGIMGDSGTVLVTLIFAAVFLVAAVFSFQQKRWAYLAGAATCIVLVLLFSFVIVDTLSNPADAQFWLVISGLPIWSLVVLFSVLSFVHAKSGTTPKKYLATSHSTGGLLTFALIGFVVGSLTVGAIASGVILRNLSGTRADIIIVPGAQTARLAFDPEVYQIGVGGTVVWINKDTTAHTVTSNTSLFNSGSLTTGVTWSYTFTQVGTYHYYCIFHPMMVGTIIVH